MSFDPSVYPAPVPDLLAAPATLSLIATRQGAAAFRPLLTGADTLPAAARAGLWLYHGYWEEAHTIAQDLKTREGSYWHAIVHRLEPDAWNSDYWFGRVGQHPIFPALARAAAALGYPAGPQWNPAAFTAACDGERDPARIRLYEAVQLAEWQLLFDFCMKGRA